MAAFAVAVMTPQPLGLLAAPVAYMAGRSAIRRLPGRQHQPIADSEVASSVELLAACLDAGAVPAAALGVTSEWLPGPLGEQLAAAAVAMSQGLDPFDVLPKSGPLAALGAVLRRSSRSGSSMSTQLTALAEELRAEQQFKRLEHARRVSVRSALPLGLCMLPAFVLLAVVPSVAGLGAGLLH